MHRLLFMKAATTRYREILTYNIFSVESKYNFIVVLSWEITIKYNGSGVLRTEIVHRVHGAEKSLDFPRHKSIQYYLLLIITERKKQ